MPRKLSVVCEDALAAEVDELAQEYELSEQEVLRQLIQQGLESVNQPASAD